VKILEIVLHLDHGDSFFGNFASLVSIWVLFSNDLGRYPLFPYEENIAITKEVVEYAFTQFDVNQLKG